MKNKYDELSQHPEGARVCSKYMGPGHKGTSEPHCQWRVSDHTVSPQIQQRYLYLVKTVWPKTRWMIMNGDDRGRVKWSLQPCRYTNRYSKVPLPSALDTAGDREMRGSNLIRTWDHSWAQWHARRQPYICTAMGSSPTTKYLGPNQPSVPHSPWAGLPGTEEA